ncbi:MULTISPECIES: hypothetical protein [Acidiplasma]|uniref:Methyltransferase n=2 Tax=Acidiplasma TaxID=507753 RepID=A0A0Q0VTT4_9ARCH|nr:MULTISPECIES: hypothetical protein [Acidiplasma]KJE49993.1 hypothetical protein TZ01_02725 [Acidiplasma sp. MBA-1]KPV47000.1 hypothetical protein SE19_02990 [Acidiplasma aeolicum]KQB34660.1 hypothetical protein AOG54_04105 [Acidiplasma aeolicum]KQB34995.1 hypothetical protein AOG55_08275 [Acidiplasma cupricumulans]WMT55196.1 MAG: hypothetical protein RE470_00770 [Acidiplasma sp.]
MGFLENYRICKHAYKNAFAVAREITAKKDRIIVNAIPNRRAIWNHEKAMLYAICKYYGQCGKNLDFFTFEDTKLPDCINFKYKYGQLMMCNLDSDPDFSDVFIFDRLSFLTGNNPDVLIISEDNGDSLLYAALNTSGKIYGINHNKNAVKNLNINEVDRRIKFINCEYSDGKNIKLSEIFEKYCNDADYVYIDAKTCENKFLSEENDSFEKIKRIAVKSYADPEVVKAKLEKYGFTASITKNAHNKFSYIYGEK